MLGSLQIVMDVEVAEAIDTVGTLSTKIDALSR
jgi:hypothetical protein